MKKSAFLPFLLFGFYKFLQLKHPILLELIKNRLHTLSYKKIFQILLVLNALYTFLQSRGLLFKKSLKNEHVFITGGGMGIGKKVSLILASLGCKITISDINIVEAQKVVDQINKNYANSAQAFECDVSDAQKVKQVAQQCTQGNFGDVTILINNAGIVSGKKMLENSEALIQKTINVNLVSHHYTVRAFLPKMIEKNSGHIVTIASMAGKVGCAGLVDYCASKFGAVGFDESLRMEMQTQKYDIKTTCICPYYINTGMFDGVKSPLIPLLNEDFVAQRIVNAIRQNETVVMLPWLMGLLYTLKSILPYSVSDWLMDVTYANRSMETFKGRQQNTIQQPQHKNQ